MMVSVCCQHFAFPYEIVVMHLFLFVEVECEEERGKMLDVLYVVEQE